MFTITKEKALEQIEEYKRKKKNEIQTKSNNEKIINHTIEEIYKEIHRVSLLGEKEVTYQKIATIIIVSDFDKIVNHFRNEGWNISKWTIKAREPEDAPPFTFIPPHIELKIIIE